MIEIHNLSKRFGRAPALQPLDLAIPAGVIWGLLGHNGAGKSTLIGMLLGQIYPTSGRVILLSSHLLTEVEQLCSHVTILKQGRLLFSGRWTEHDDRRLIVRVDRQAEAEAGLARAGLTEPFTQPAEARLAPGRQAAEVAEWLVAQGFRLAALAPAPRSLEAFYLRHDRADEEQCP